MPSTAKLIAASAMLAVSTAASAATLNTLNQQLFSGNAAATFNYDATGAEKLVVMLATESAFNNQTVSSVSVTFNGVQMDLAAEDNTKNVSFDGGYVGIFYLDNPFQGNAILQYDASHTAGNANGNGGLLSVLGLTSPDGIVAPGVEATASDDSLSTSLVTLGDDSLIFAAGQNSGSNNSASNVVATGSLSQIHQGFWGNRWASFASAGAGPILSSGTNVNLTFTTTNTAGNLHIAAAEFTAVDAPNAIPEPTSLLVGSAGLGLIALRRRRNS